MTEKERMLAGKLYRACDEQLEREHMRKWELLQAIHAEKRRERLPELFRELLGDVGRQFWIEPPFRCDYGSHIHIGEHFYCNCDCIFLDVCDITIGDDVFIAPRVCLFTAAHPIDAQVRNQELEFGAPIRIGSSVWLGGNTVVNPGVTIGDNTVIGAGSVVTRDIPSGVVAAGNPCRVLRPITREDRTLWQARAEEYRAWQAHRQTL